MLKKIALMIPSLRQLHAERNTYAASVKILSEENALLSAIVKSTGDDALKQEVDSISKGLNKLICQISRIEEKIKEPAREVAVNDAGENHSVNLAGSGLFVVGHARSGTTILVDALNSCGDVYCLGEANFHKTIDRKDFVEWFNTQHRSFDNPMMKSTFLPEMPAQCGWDVLKKLSENYKLVGEKVAFLNEESGHDFNSFFRFSTKYFQKSNYVCVVRHPRAVAGSCVEMFMAGQLNSESLKVVAVSQLQTYYLILSLVLSLPNVFVLVHERISQAAFDTLGNELRVDLHAAGGFYDFGKSVSKLNLHLEIDDEAMARTLYYYNLIGEIIDLKSLRPKEYIKVRNTLFELHSELKSINRLPFLE